MKKGKIIRVDLSQSGMKDVAPQIVPMNPDPGTVMPMLESRASEMRISFDMSPSVLTGWNSDADNYPRATVRYAVPDNDLPRVRGWLSGVYDNVTQPASATLLRNLSNAVETTLESYFDTARGHDLFTSPCRVGWAFRRSDGSRSMTQPMVLTVADTRSPLMSILSGSVAEGSATTLTAIHNMPCALWMRASGIPSGWGDITHIDIVASPPVSLLPSSLSATGVYTALEDGARYRAYRYNRLDETRVLNSASIQNDLRVIASIPVSDISDERTMAPVIPGALSNWKMLDKYAAGSGTTDPTEPDAPDGDDSTGWEPYIDKETGPLDLGDPERRKWLYMAALRGCFDREALRIRIYASRHRQEWRLIADGKRGWVSAATHLGFRWYKVRITGSMRRQDYVDAVSFLVTRYR